MWLEIFALHFGLLHHNPYGRVPDSQADTFAQGNEEDIFLVPLGKGIRLAVCSVSKKKIHGLAAKIKATLDAVGAKQ